MAGALKTLYGALAASSYLTGVALVYGEEEVHDQSQNLPMVVMVPTDGTYTEATSGYSGDMNAAIERSDSIDVNIDLYLWGFDTTPAATPIDHADATETLRASVLAALQDQRAQYTDVISVAYGLYFQPLRERWQAMQGAFNRYGRALVLTVSAEVTVTTPVPQEATVTSYTLSKTITAGPT